MTSQDHYNDELFRFLHRSPTAFHAIDEMARLLGESGFHQLSENRRWQLQKGQGYFVVREGALISFLLGSSEDTEDGFRIVATHSDSPGLQLKPRAAVTTAQYMQLGVEVYGGPLLNPWFDRDLSLAGRVSCRQQDGNLKDYLVDFQRPMLVIPSLAIHFDREANKGKNIDKQKALPPLAAQAIDDQLPDFTGILLARLKEQYPQTSAEEVLAFDLFCYDPQPASYLGMRREFISGGRLDNLLSCHVAVEALRRCDRTRNALFLCTNHEENGSTSATGANGSFIEAILTRLATDAEGYRISLSNSFLISMDNAHAVHPNFRDQSEPNHDIVLNGGPVIKINANQRYATNSRSSALFKLLAREAGIDVQEFVMRSDLPCGSTIGPMTAARLGIATIDVGAPTLGMHSIRELTGHRDPWFLFRVTEQFFRSPTSIRSRS